MKKLLLSFLIVAPLAANATAPQKCYIIASLTNVVMQAKQMGVPLDEMLEINEQEYKQTHDEITYKLTDYIVHDAYSQPNFKEKVHKSSQLAEFNSKYFNLCLESK